MAIRTVHASGGRVARLEARLASLLREMLLRLHPRLRGVAGMLALATLVALCHAAATQLVLRPLAALMLLSTPTARPVDRNWADPETKAEIVIGAEGAARPDGFVFDYPALPYARPEIDLIASYLLPTDTLLVYGPVKVTALPFAPLVRQVIALSHDSHDCAREAQVARANLTNVRVFCVPVSSQTGRENNGNSEGDEHEPDSMHVEETYDRFRGFVDFPKHNLSGLYFDKVLLDGPARVACAFRILPQLQKQSILFMHDFFLRPDHYSRVLEVYTEVARVVAHGPVVADNSGTPFGLLALRQKGSDDHRDTGALAPLVPKVSHASMEHWYRQFTNIRDTEERASLEAAFRFIPSTNASGYPKEEHSRSMCRRTSVLRILLDFVALPLLVASYYLCYSFYDQVLVHEIFGSCKSVKRLPETYADENYHSSSTSSNATKPESLTKLSDTSSQGKLE
jgi:hypothetical protein